MISVGQTFLWDVYAMLAEPRHYYESHGLRAWPLGRKEAAMMYPYLTLGDGTEVVHSELLDGE